MRISILTYGTRGDVQRYLALAQGHQERGHEPTVAAFRNHETLVGHSSVPYVAIVFASDCVLNALPPKTQHAQTRPIKQLFSPGARHLCT